MFRGQNENIHCCRNVVVVGGTVVFVFSIPIQQAENLQRIRSNRGSRLSPTISFVENNSPAKAGLVKGSGWGISIKGRRKPRIKKKPQKQSKDREKNQSKKKHKKKFTQRGESVLPLLSSLQKTTQKSVSTEAGTFVCFLHYLKICWKNKSRPWAQEQKGKAEAKVSSRRKSPTAVPARASPSSPTPLTEQVRGFFFSHYLN
jgi:hypothetical protein